MSALNLSKNPIYDHCFSQDRKTVAITKENDVLLFDVSGAKPSLITTLTHHDKPVTAVDISSDGKIVTCSQDRNALVWEPSGDGKTYKPTLVLLRINRAATCARWAPNGKKFAVGSSDRVVAICYYEAANDWWISKHLKKPLRSTILSVDWHPNNVLLACGSADGHVRVFSTYINGRLLLLDMFLCFRWIINGLGELPALLRTLKYYWVGIKPTSHQFIVIDERERFEW